MTDLHHSTDPATLANHLACYDLDYPRLCDDLDRLLETVAYEGAHVMNMNSQFVVAPQVLAPWSAKRPYFFTSRAASTLGSSAWHKQGVRSSV